MSRKDFVAIAAALAESNASRDTCKAVARVLAASNPRFDLERFMNAAYLESDAS